MNQLSEFDQLHYDLQVFVAPIKELIVTDKSSCEVATATLREVSRWKKKIEEKRKEIVGPMNDAVKSINEYAKKISAPLDDPESFIKRQLLSYEQELEKVRAEQRRLERIEQERREKEAAEKIKAAHEEAESIAMFSKDAAAEAIHKANAESERIAFEAKKAHWDASKEINENKVKGTTLRWVHKIVNQDLVPRQFLMVDEKALREHYMEEIKKGHTPQILGVEIYQEKSISVR